MLLNIIFIFLCISKSQDLSSNKKSSWDAERIQQKQSLPVAVFSRDGNGRAKAVGRPCGEAQLQHPCGAGLGCRPPLAPQPRSPDTERWQLRLGPPNSDRKCARGILIYL